ncbi:Chymotrypsin-like elastase family member 2A [Smittium culicis]|uniref:Chymotrypsin-like elastase family member 2A n=1 Tax=Smittium culicis TaxID=133412 RepID=A0A1R1XIK2_9FUNG|nr:Chymotrypsin-like elastase family member 2A [Smittium culicis]
MHLSAYSMLILSTISASVSAQASRIPRVINGSNSSLKNFPYMVNYDTHFQNGRIGGCGGTLITSKHILTAAHCLYENFDNTIEPSRIIASYGNINYDSFADNTFNVKSFAKYPTFSNRISYSTGDIAILELDEPVDSSVVSFSKIYDLPITDEMVGTLAGWGDLNIPPPKPLQQTELKVSSEPYCAQANPNWTGNNGLLICVAPDGITSECNGDSGGPISLLNLPGSPQFGVYSIYNYLDNSNQTCNAISTIHHIESPIMYIDFIAQTVGVPKELLLYSTEGTLQEKDLAIQKITGFKRDLEVQPDGTSSTTSSSTSTTSSSTSTTSSPSSTTSSPSSTSSSPSSTTSSSTSTTSSSSSTTSSSSSTTSSPSSTTISSSTSSVSIETPAKKPSFCSTGVLLDDGNGNITNCSKDDKVCGLNSQNNYDCVNETYYKRFCIQNDILVYGENGSVRDCTLERKQCGKNSQGLSTCIDKEPSKNTCDSTTILNYNNGTTENCALSYRTCGKHYSEGFACIDRNDLPPRCILDTMLIVNDRKVRDCAHVGQTCGRTPEGNFDCIDI